MKNRYLTKTAVFFIDHLIVCYQIVKNCLQATIIPYTCLITTNSRTYFLYNPKP
jgi:hypothetical protein